MASSTPRPRLPSSHRIRVENEIIRKRDKQYKYEQLWQTTTKYFDDFNKKNKKYEEWTSPRYYQTNTKLMNEFLDKRKKQENVEKRREKLRKLLQEDERFEQIELMIQKTKQQMLINDDNDKDKLDILKDLNENFKIEESDRKRHEAEYKLYHQWRNSNPILHEYERYKQLNEIKLSWLDQQIEKRLMKEKAEEECRETLQKHQQQLIEEEEKIEETKKTLQQKQEELKVYLEKQINELHEKNRISEELKMKESEELKKRLEFEVIEEQSKDLEKKRQNRECALYNLKQYKLKLKKKAQMIEENLDEQKRLIEQLKNLEILQKIEDTAKREELQTTLEQFLIYNKEQKQLEKVRQYKLDFLFDSEAKYQYEQQDEIWQKEENARQQLIKDIFKTIQLQIDENLKKNQQKQQEILEERELLLKTIEQYNDEMEELKQKEIELKKNQCIENKQQIKLKNLQKKIDKTQKLDRINKELESIRKEEERLKREILNLQRRQGPIRPTRSRILP